MISFIKKTTINGNNYVIQVDGTGKEIVIFWAYGIKRKIDISELDKGGNLNPFSDIRCYEEMIDKDNLSVHEWLSLKRSAGV